MAHTHEFDCPVCGVHLDSQKDLDRHNREKHSQQASSGSSGSSSSESSSNSPLRGSDRSRSDRDF